MGAASARPFKFTPKTLQPRSHAPIDQPVANPDDHPAKDRRVYGRRRLHSLSETGGELLFYGGELLRAEFNRSSDLCLGDALLFVGKPPECLGYRPGIARSAFAHKQFRKVQGKGLDVERALHHRQASLDRDAPVGQQWSQV